jgi:hypothetical protein
MKKKFTGILAAVLSLTMFTACGSTNETTEIDATTEAVTTTVPTTTAPIEEYEEFVLYDSSKCKITFCGIQATSGYVEIKLEVENYTDDSIIITPWSGCTFNGYDIFPDSSDSVVSANSKKIDNIAFKKSYLSDANIAKISDIKLRFYLRDSDYKETWHEYAEKEFTLNPAFSI